MLKISCLFFMLWTTSCFACSMLKNNEGELERKFVSENPAKAKYAFTVSVLYEKREPDSILRSFKKFLIPEKKWTNLISSKLPTTSDGCGGPMVIKEEKYLFLSNTNLTADHQFVVELSKAGEFISKLANKVDFIGEINPAWQYCKKNSECISMKNLCNSEVSLNMEYKVNYSQFLKSSKAKQCLQNKLSKKPILKCVDFFCS